jgi:hypothetical protein
MQFCMRTRASVLADVLLLPPGGTGTISQANSYAELHTRCISRWTGTDTLTTPRSSAPTKGVEQL